MSYEESDYKKFLEILEETPFIIKACRKSDISRATVYRRMKTDYEFKKLVNEALEIGRGNLVDVAEMALSNEMQSGNLAAIKYCLKYNSPRYSERTDPPGW